MGVFPNTIVRCNPYSPTSTLGIVPMIQGDWITLLDRFMKLYPPIFRGKTMGLHLYIRRKESNIEHYQ